MARSPWTQQWACSGCAPFWRRRATLRPSGLSCAPSSSPVCTAACYGAIDHLPRQSALYLESQLVACNSAAEQAELRAVSQVLPSWLRAAIRSYTL